MAEAREAFVAAERARAAARAATLNFHERADAMAGAGAGLIRSIRIFAETSGDVDVYALAHLPAPAGRAPIGPPGRPYKLSVSLIATGALGLAWRCDNPAGSQGTVYEVRRRLGAGAFTFLGLAGERSFVDQTLPAGAGGSGAIVYQITAVRSTVRGEPAQFPVNLGVDGAAGGVAAVKGARARAKATQAGHAVHRLAG